MKDDRAYTEHILHSISKIRDFTNGLIEEDFAANEMIQDAVIRNIEIIGEATKKISDNLKSSHPNIPWKEMAGMRDKLIHDYMGIDVAVVWKTVEKDIPLLERLLLEMDF